VLRVLKNPFYLTIFLWFFLIGISLLGVILLNSQIAIILANYGSIIYLFIIFVLVLYYRKRKKELSDGLWQGFKVILLTWVLFSVIFLLGFILGFKLL